MNGGGGGDVQEMRCGEGNQFLVYMVVSGDRGEQNIEMNFVLRQCRARSTARLRCSVDEEMISRRCAKTREVCWTRFGGSGLLTDVGIYGEPSRLQRDPNEDHVR